MEATPSTKSATAEDVRPFTIEVSDQELDDLRHRINATKWPDREVDPSQGVQLETIQALASYWGTDYDWRKFEERFAALPHFITEIDGVDIHFIHVRSEHKDALPLIVTHGWPGSTFEQLKISDPLTKPTEDGASTAGAFHLVIPGLLGIHTNMPATLSPEISKGVQSGEPKPEGLPAEEKNAYEILVHFFATGTGYAGEMGNRPQTLYGIADSPVGLAAWMLDHDERSYELIARAFAGNPGGLSRDDVLDNVTHYWLTNSGVSSARLYWESHLAFFDAKGVEIPVGVTVFPDELYPAPRSWAERAYPKLIHFNKVAEGGHFAAWEQPQTFSEEIRATFRSL